MLWNGVIGKLQDRWLIITDSPSGLGCQLTQVAKGFALAKASKRKMIVYWNKNSYYSNGEDENGFEAFFRQPDFSDSDFIRKSLANRSDCLGSYLAGLPFHNHMSFDAALADDRRILILSQISHPIDGMTMEDRQNFYGPIMRKLQFSDKVLQHVLRFLKDFDLSNLSAFHVRGGDKILEQPELMELVPKYISIAQNMSSELDLYLMTDTNSLIEKFKSEVVSVSYNRYCHRSEWCLHGNNDDWHMGQRNRFTVEALLDIAVGKSAKYFYGNSRSWFSLIIAYWRTGEKKESCFVDLM